jgi:isoquinoline 1-oxidoreductase subunit alpha
MLDGASLRRKLDPVKSATIGVPVTANPSPTSQSQMTASQGAGFMTTLDINGKRVDVDVPAETPLLWTLRDELGMTGTKFGCGMALCGACTVHLDGAPTRSCITPISAAVGKKITTIEAIGDTPVGERVVAAWRAMNVPQCGYCQSGQIMQAAGLLATTPKPTDAQIDEAMAGNICRCGTYQRIRAAIKAAAGEA